MHIAHVPWRITPCRDDHTCANNRRLVYLERHFKKHCACSAMFARLNKLLRAKAAFVEKKRRTTAVSKAANLITRRAAKRTAYEEVSPRETCFAET